MDRALAVFDALAKHPRLDVLATIVGEEARAIASARSYTGWPESAKAKLEALGLSEDEGTTPFGDLRALLRRGPETEGDGHLLSALAAHAIAGAGTPLDDDAAQTKAAADLLWLAANTPFVALAHLDRALGEELADGMWGAIAARVRRVETSQLARAEALVGAAAIAASSSRVAKKLAARLRREVTDRWVKAALGREEGAVLDGELGPSPRSPIVTAMLAVTGLLFLSAGARAFAKVALALKRPATVTFSPLGVEIESKTELLGRTLRERRIRIERTSLVHAAREVRYPALAFYAGLLALAIGSYLGVSLFVDGTRSASPSLLALGLGIVVAGVAIDFVLTGLAPGLRGQCRLLLVPRRGPTIAIEGLDAAPTDRALESLKA